ncbi:hypothetical protein FO131_19535 [Salmonella bongori]|nr:hypothetical protein [Salmonella bongori serovar 48:i:-]ECG9254701.1 hypothetical protein [Salmonella bongori]MBA2166186.1 hypothetical protein [Salmonella bongori serovar 48:z81:-]EDP8708167.1 hypothetical protein [Salmonella bongori]EDP8725787.1 hypothetical protein [Salmonella bongori]
MITSLTFRETRFNITNHAGAIWLRGTEIAKALGMSKSDAVSQIYYRNIDEFSESMSLTLKLSVHCFSGRYTTKKVRVFSLRGAHLVAMLARTPVAKEFRRWVLDILDNEVETLSRKAKADTSTDDRTPLRDAVNLLVGKKGIMYPEAYNYIHQRFGISHIDELPKRQIPQAIEYLHRLALDCEQPPKQQNQSSIIAVKKGRVLTEYRDGLIIDQKILKDEIIVGPMSVFEWIQRKAGFVPVRKEFIENLQGAFNGICPSNA